MADENKDVVDKPKDDVVKDTGKDETQSLREKIAALEKEREEWKSKDLNLNDKVKLDKEQKDKKDSDTKTLESALKFNLMSSTFLKENESVLPKQISDIFQAAEKEKYESGIQKANATKAAIVQNFFEQQFNMDLLTESQKTTLADYLKLTKNGKEDKAHAIYENLFEPALGMLKRIKKAEELNRNKGGLRDGDSLYKEKLMGLSQKHYLGEKK